MNTLPSVFDRPKMRGPLKELKNMQRQMDRFFDQMWGETSFDLEPKIFTGLEGPVFAPSCDINETDSHYLLTFDIPGVKKDEVKIDLRDNMLTVSGERKEEREESKRGLTRSERFYGNFERSFTLPMNVKGEQIEANYSDGVLRVAIPKSEPTQVQQIKIGESKAGFIDKFLGHKKEESKKSQSH